MYHQWYTYYLQYPHVPPVVPSCSVFQVENTMYIVLWWMLLLKTYNIVGGYICILGSGRQTPNPISVNNMLYQLCNKGPAVFDQWLTTLL